MNGKYNIHEMININIILKLKYFKKNLYIHIYIHVYIHN